VPRIAAIAVLPFENLSHDPAEQYFADSMMQMLVGDMQQVAAFRTIAPPSVMQYKKAPKPLPQIDRELRIDAVVEGSVLRSGDRVRFTANLTHAPTERRLWAQTYERDLRDVRSLHGEILRDVARAINARLTRQEEAAFFRSRPVNPPAYDALVRGMWGATQLRPRHT
jgi:TolB-like protein